MKDQPQLKINLKNTTEVLTPSGKKVFQQGYLVREVSKFIVASTESALIPIPIFFDPETGKILSGTVPPELREMYKDDLI